MTEVKQVFFLSFSADELIFDETETKAILKFFFRNDHKYIDDIAIDDKIIGFAQTISIEAVDASYAIGYVKIIYNVFYMRPPTKVSMALKKFGKKAATHWFKHARATDLTQIKIYESVRSTINRNFRKHFIMISEGIVKNKAATDILIAKDPFGNNFDKKRIWSC